MITIKKSLKVLESESEMWLNYLYGQQSKILKHNKSKNRTRKTASIYTIKFILNCLSKFRFRLRKKTSSSNYLFYASSKNQFDSMINVRNAVIETGENTIFLILKKDIISSYSFNKHSKTEQVEYSFLDLLNALLLSLIRMKKMRALMNEQDQDFHFSHYEKYLSVHIYLPYFIRLLSNNHAIQFVITSNDHNVSNRCLLAAARICKVKTVYIQHASVSCIFPRLNYNMSFLDGIKSFEVYQKCVNNFPENCTVIKNRKVYLTGIQKTVKVCIKELNGLYIGIAINPLDDIDDICELIMSITRELNIVKIFFRVHPSQSKENITQVVKFCERQENICISMPSKHSLKEFFNDINILVAGDSSIILEAELAGVFSIYYNKSDQPHLDYYGFVSEGLCNSAVDFQAVISLIKNQPHAPNREKALSRYSASYGTAWYGCEGKLVASIIKRQLISEFEIGETGVRF